MFITELSLKSGSWQAFERALSRLLLYEGYTGIRLVGQSGDRGADVIAHKGGKRWLFQVKHWKKKVGADVVDQTLSALKVYRADIPVIVALSGFEDPVHETQRVLLSRGIPLQLWDTAHMVKRATRLALVPLSIPDPRKYQEEPIKTIVQHYISGFSKRAMVVMATGLGKTFVACDSLRRINALKPIRVLGIVHTNELVYQLERAFWPFLNTRQETVVWNGYEHPSTADLERAPIVIACLKSVAEYITRGEELPHFDVVLIDECHHVGGTMYEKIIEETNAGKGPSSPFLFGLTATPWRPDETDLTGYFGNPLVCIDIVAGLNNGFLSNVDYRMYTDNINWKALENFKGTRLSPKQVNKTLFIKEWDDAVVYELQRVWTEQEKPRAIVFCGTIDHAITMRDRINALGFCNASAIYSQTATGKTIEPYERNRILCDFHDGAIDVLCAVDILNEGVDVPDVNIIVFQRVTHSRRIFVQQLGRGLRVSPEKKKVIVLDFVSDIRRFAAGLELKDNLSKAGEEPRGPIHVKLNHKVTFKKAGSEDPGTETFLRQWLEDVAAVEKAGEDASVLKFPPALPGGRA